ncbi:MAG TPA: ABC transporter permease [Actinocrinis sp.]|jgi:NitT/TauT family transport system permease protein
MPVPQQQAEITAPAPVPGPPQRGRSRSGENTPRWVVLTLQIGLLVVLLGSWQVLADTKTIDTFFFGSPTGTWDQLISWIQHGTPPGPLQDQIWVTFQEALIGFVIGVALGVFCGVLLARNALLARVFKVYIGVMNSVPRIVLGSVFVIWFGLGLKSKVALVVVLVFFSVFFNAFQGARDVDRGLESNARILGASRTEVMLHVVLPSTFTWIIASLRIAFGLAITGAVVGELIGATQGLGLLIYEAQGNFDPDGVYAALIITTVLALVAEGLITLLERRALRWRPQHLNLGSEP